MCFKYQKEHQGFAKYYDQICNMYSTTDTAKAVGWFNNNTQNLRFLAASLIYDLDNNSVLDLGCGQAAFLDYLEKVEIKVDYTGLDYSQKMLDIAKNNHPNTKFLQADFLDPEFKGNYDFIISSGAFNQRVQDQYEYMELIIKKMFAMANKGVSINMLSNKAPENMRFESSFYYYDPTKILEYCFSLTKYTELKHNYLPNDFTVFLYK
jgi:ubiquinone/menaquinone biosynthesis C-methylase UbiE